MTDDSPRSIRGCVRTAGTPLALVALVLLAGTVPALAAGQRRQQSASRPAPSLPVKRWPCRSFSPAHRTDWPATSSNSPLMTPQSPDWRTQATPTGSASRLTLS